MSSFLNQRKLKLKQHLLRNQTRQSIAIRVRIMPSLGITGHTTMPPRQRSPTGGQANFCISSCGDLQSLQPFRATGAPFAIGQGCVSAERKSPAEKGLSKAGLML